MLHFNKTKTIFSVTMPVNCKTSKTFYFLKKTTNAIVVERVLILDNVKLCFFFYNTPFLFVCTINTHSCESLNKYFLDKRVFLKLKCIVIFKVPKCFQFNLENTPVSRDTSSDLVGDSCHVHFFTLTP